MLPFGMSWTETVVIFLLALVMFGPKKLPELGRNVAKALGEFRRASSELKYTWDQQMRELERDTQDVKQATAQLENEIHSYSYDTSYDYMGDSAYDYPDSSSETASANESTGGATAVQGADVDQSVAQDAGSAEPEQKPAQA